MSEPLGLSLFQYSTMKHSMTPRQYGRWVRKSQQLIGTVESSLQEISADETGPLVLFYEEKARAARLLIEISKQQWKNAGHDLKDESLFW